MIPVIFPYGLFRGATKSEIDSSFREHEKRMVGSTILTKKVIVKVLKKQIVKYRKIDMIPIEIAKDYYPVVQYHDYDKEEITEHYYFFEEVFEKSWNKYMGTEKIKTLWQEPAKEITKFEVEKAKKHLHDIEFRFE